MLIVSSHSLTPSIVTASRKSCTFHVMTLVCIIAEYIIPAHAFGGRARTHTHTHTHARTLLRLSATSP